MREQCIISLGRGGSQKETFKWNLKNRVLSSTQGWRGHALGQVMGTIQEYSLIKACALCKGMAEVRAEKDTAV